MHPDYINHPSHADHDPARDINFKTKTTMSEETKDHRLSGGECPKSPAHRHLETLIKAKDDVFELRDLAEMCDGKFLYLIQTPFAGFPKFVIGTTDAENKHPHILLQTGAEWSAEKAWAEFRHHPSLQTFDTEAL